MNRPTDRPNTDTFYAAQQQARAIDLYLFRRLRSLFIRLGVETSMCSCRLLFNSDSLYRYAHLHSSEPSQVAVTFRCGFSLCSMSWVLSRNSMIQTKHTTTNWPTIHIQIEHSIERPVCCECASVWLCKCVLRVSMYFTIKSKRTRLWFGSNRHTNNTLNEAQISGNNSDCDGVCCLALSFRRMYLLAGQTHTLGMEQQLHWHELSAKIQTVFFK